MVYGVLFSAAESGSWSRSVGYDRYGNPSVTVNTGRPTRGKSTAESIYGASRNSRSRRVNVMN